MAVRDNPFIIKSDFREDDSKVREILTRQYGIKLTRANLSAGDYIIDDEIVIERKTTLDFAQSVIDGRLFKQAAKMKQLFDFFIFIIEGDNLYNPSINIHPHAILGALVSLALAWRIPVFFSKDMEETALLLWLIANQKTLTYSEFSYRPGRRPKQLRKKQLYILEGLPQIGPKLAIQLLEHFGSVEAVITASEEELMGIQGLGKIKAMKIKEAVTNDSNTKLL